jgi:hypothetical protein
MRLQHRAFSVFADYHQVYLLDAGLRPMAPEDGTDDDVLRRVKVAPNQFILMPERNMTVGVEIEVHDTEPPFKLSEWDHIAEGSLHLPTGRLSVIGCTDSKPAALLRVAPAWYRVRSFHGGFDTIDESGLEGNDRYLAVLWPAPEGELRVLKQWDDAAGG